MYVDDFPFFGSSLTHLEPELKLFEVNDIGDDGDDDFGTIISQTLNSSSLGSR